MEKRSFTSYRNPAIAVDLVVFGYHSEQLSILLLNRKEAPFKGRWTLPGAFLGLEETFRQVCQRILETKLGIADLYLEQLYSFDQPNRDPRGRVLSVAYFALVNPDHYDITAGEMANDVKWFSMEELPRLGFDHTTIVQMAAERLRAKILYHPVGFELLHHEFTLPELHRLYETILGIPIDRRNFRRKILDSGYIVMTGEKKTGAQHRHPDIYQFNSNIDPGNFTINI
ncbi:NUDIX hydrolase [Flavihumibacter petaseus]|uniref:Putative hydrolase n=1 Tax=Flavihumibacter petaseus NBRC 106054 TaxID=1220578 RepID=A0A0E9N1H3_9BACT|nr:NUDIX domain-containing protein [Flavihumibacter petaseus]GAO43195.1 putative hydrolase [Flavihumibacter petaseus NBRC 106054]